MTRKHALSLVLAVLVLLVMPQFAPAAGPKAREITCYVLVEEGDSAEGNSLFLQKMGMDTQALSLIAPTRFSFASVSSFTRTEGGFTYESGQPKLVARKNALALYSVEVKFSVASLPKAYKTVTVDVTMADLAATKDLIQPAAKAIELAAAKAGLKAGTAWILDMKMPTPKAIRVKVGLAR